MIANLVDLRDVGMLKLSDRLGLCAETGQCLEVGAGVEDHLQCDNVLEARLKCLVDDAHAAAANYFTHFIIANVMDR